MQARPGLDSPEMLAKAQEAPEEFAVDLVYAFNDLLLSLIRQMPSDGATVDAKEDAPPALAPTAENIPTLLQSIGFPKDVIDMMSSRPS